VNPDCHNLPKSDGDPYEVGPRELAAAALAAGAKVRAAAQHAGVSERQVYRYLHDADFRTLIAEYRSQMVTRAVGRLAGGLGKAAGKLLELLNSGDERTALAAAKAVLECGPKLAEHEELVGKVHELQVLLKELQGRVQPNR
jgi:hypothetical protein